jgi:hypothetical protein
MWTKVYLKGHLRTTKVYVHLMSLLVHLSQTKRKPLSLLAVQYRPLIQVDLRIPQVDLHSMSTQVYLMIVRKVWSAESILRRSTQVSLRCSSQVYKRETKVHLWRN